jgi:hypothetical protein
MRSVTPRGVPSSMKIPRRVRRPSCSFNIGSAIPRRRRAADGRLHVLERTYSQALRRHRIWAHSSAAFRSTIRPAADCRPGRPDGRRMRTGVADAARQVGAREPPRRAPAPPPVPSLDDGSAAEGLVRERMEQLAAAPCARNAAQMDPFAGAGELDAVGKWRTRDMSIVGTTTGRMAYVRRPPACGNCRRSAGPLCRGDYRC